jgi:hypothetical protein
MEVEVKGVERQEVSKDNYYWPMLADRNAHWHLSSRWQSSVWLYRFDVASPSESVPWFRRSRSYPSSLMGEVVDDLLDPSPWGKVSLSPFPHRQNPSSYDRDHDVDGSGDDADPYCPTRPSSSSEAISSYW